MGMNTLRSLIQTNCTASSATAEANTEGKIQAANTTKQKNLSRERKTASYRHIPWTVMLGLWHLTLHLHFNVKNNYN